METILAKLRCSFIHCGFNHSNRSPPCIYCYLHSLVIIIISLQATYASLAWVLMFVSVISLQHNMINKKFMLSKAVHNTIRSILNSLQIHHGPSQGHYKNLKLGIGLANEIYNFLLQHSLTAVPGTSLFTGLSGLGAATCLGTPPSWLNFPPNLNNINYFRNSVLEVKCIHIHTRA